MNYITYIGNSHCSSCGRKITKIVEIDGKHFGTECAKDIIGKDLTAPVWLYKVAGDYIQYKIQNSQEFEKHDVDFVTNFFNDSYGHEFDCFDKLGFSKVWHKAIKINGKSVRVDWQEEIAEYLKAKHAELIN